MKITGFYEAAAALLADKVLTCSASAYSSFVIKGNEVNFFLLKMQTVILSVMCPPGFYYSSQ